MSDFNVYISAQERRRRYSAQSDAAQALLEKAYLEERMAELLSQHEPVASIGINRDKLRVAINFIRTGRL